MKYQLTGEYEIKIDAKGRIKLPANLLKQLTTTGSFEFVVNRGYDTHLVLYPIDVWQEKIEELESLNINIKNQRRTIRYFHRGATQVTSDSSERVLIPKNLIQYAGIEKQIVLFAYRDQIEIWSKDAYQEMIDEEPENYSDLAEEAFGSAVAAKPEKNDE